MAAQHKFSGIYTATPTPFTSDWQVDGAAIAAHAERLIAAGADGITPLGGTGEYTSLSTPQRMAVVEHSVAAVKGRIPVVPGVLSPGIGDAVDMGKRFMAAGADALMVVTPYYFRPTQDGIVDYFKRFSDEVDADIMLYEIPYRTGVSLHFETVAKLVDQTRVVGIKACNPDLAQQMRVAELTADRMAILTGEEDVLPLHVAMGAVGAVISSSNILTRQWAHVLKLGLEGRAADAIAAHAKLRPFIDAIFAEPNPAPIKAALALMGHPMGEVLPPMRPASQALRDRLSKLLPDYIAREKA